LSQLYTSAQFLSPASVGNGIYQNRVQSNYRSQMLAGNQLYKTIVVGWDGRYKNKNEDVVNYLGIGGQIISDQVMNGVLQTNYATLNAAYHLFFDEDLKKASDELKKDSKAGAKPKQKSASKKMKQMSQDMQSDMEMGEQEQMEEDVAMLRQILDNLLAYSFSQESVMGQFKGLKRGSPSFNKNLKIQQDLKHIEIV
jgi:hypothetical protein